MNIPNPLHFRFVKIPFVMESSFLAGFLAVFTLAYYFLGYIPVSGALRTVKDDLNRISTEIHGYELFLSTGLDTGNIERLKSYKDIEASYLQTLKQIPSIRESSKVMQEISSSRTGLSIESIQSSPLEDKGEYLRMQVTLTIKGDFPSIGAYITSIEKSDRVMHIGNITMAREPQVPLTARLEMSLYFLKEGAI